MDKEIKIVFVGGGINSVVGSAHYAAISNESYGFQKSYEGLKQFTRTHISSLSNSWEDIQVL